MSVLPLALISAVGILLSPVEVLTPSDAVKIALQQNPRLRAARAERDAALAQNDRDRPVARPDVTVSAVGQLQGPRVTFPRADGGDETVVPEKYGRVELMVEQILYRAGAGAARARFAAQNRSAEWDRRKAEQETAIETLRAYYALQGAEAQAAVARDGVELARKQLDLTRTMLTAGTASERDVKASDADLAESEQGRSKADDGVALARANLNRLLGREPYDAVTLAAPGSLPTVSGSIADAQKSAMEKRPEIMVVRENLAAARAGVSLAATQDSPTLSARALAALQTPTALTDTRFAAAGLVFKWSPFDQGKTRADVREAKARVAQLEALEQEARLAIAVEVEKAWRDMRGAEERIGFAGRQTASAEAALDVSRLRYEAGSAMQLEVSGSLFRVIKARANRAQAETDLRMAHAELLYAIGEISATESAR